MNPAEILVVVLAAVIAIPLGIIAIIYLVVPICKGIIWLIRQVFGFVFGMIADSLRLIGAVVTMLVLALLTISNIIIGRWSASAHFGRAIQGEAKTLGRCVYRLFIGHPARLLCLCPLTEGLERRLPEVVAQAPGADRPGKRTGQFDGYAIVGSLAGGGSGGRLYVARPSPQKLAAFARNGATGVEQVVIKSFSLGDGSSLPQIVRENRALDAAKRLGLILEHDMTDQRFYYVMRYVPGESLGLLTQRLHAVTGGGGLGRAELGQALGYTRDLLGTLCTYHSGGLWHKDVKPDNIIVSDGHAHLVDFGLITPLRSSMTLTTHGTEYFRDPEMVRMALKGVKVHEVDGAKFDIYAVGAVLFSMIENSFPAHGGLSQITKPCPEALRWIVRRAMTDYDKRYSTAAAMLADIDAVARAADPYALKPLDLPSLQGALVMAEAQAPAASPVAAPGAPVPGTYPGDPLRGGPADAGAGAGMGRGVVDGEAWRPQAAPGGYGAGQAAAFAGTPVPPAGAAQPGAGRVKPDIRVIGWWTGQYAAATPAQPAYAEARSYTPPRGPVVRPVAFAGGRAGLSAREQVERARARAQAARTRVLGRMNQRRQDYASGINAGVAVALFLFLAACVALAAWFIVPTSSHRAAARRGSQPMVDVDVAAFGHAAIPPVPPGSVEDRVRAATGRAHAAAAAVTTALQEHADAPGIEGQTILVVRERSSEAGKTSKVYDAQLAALRQAGFTLTGDAVAGPAEAPEADESIQLVADLRKTVGTRLFMSDDASVAVRQWLSSGHKADMVLWLAPSPKDREKPAAWLVAPEEFDSQIVRIAEDKLRKGK